MESIFNNNRYICLVLNIIIGVLGWYNLILYTASDYLPMPDQNQYNGLCIVLVLSVLYWLRNCYTIKLQ